MYHNVLNETDVREEHGLDCNTNMHDAMFRYDFHPDRLIDSLKLKVRFATFGSE